MSRWIVFDQAAADAVQSRGVRPETRADADQPGKIVSMAVDARSAVAMVPTGIAGKVLVMSLRRAAPAPTQRQTASNMAPAGFLGLSDTIDMDSEPEQPTKWWQKIIG